MTNVGDLMRQIETTLNDPYCPPTPDERETLDRILYKVYSGTVDFKGSR